MLLGILGLEGATNRLSLYAGLSLGAPQVVLKQLSRKVVYKVLSQFLEKYFLQENLRKKAGLFVAEMLVS